MSNNYRKNFFNDTANYSKSGLYECVSCHRKFKKDDITIDHILPQSYGGGHGVDNLQCMCRSCNSSKKNKTDRTVDDYIRNGKRLMEKDTRNILGNDLDELNTALSKGKSGIKNWLKNNMKGLILWAFLVHYLRL